MSWTDNIFVDKLTEDRRYSVCNSCVYFSKITKICSKCKCFMPAKVKLPIAQCPESKWPIQQINLEEK